MQIGDDAGTALSEAIGKNATLLDLNVSFCETLMGGNAHRDIVGTPDGHPVGGMAETGIIIADSMSIPMSACRMITAGKIERAIVACENDLSRISGH